MQKLTAEHKKTLSAQIKAFDPKGEFVTVTPSADFKGGFITYNKGKGIILGETSYRLTDEEYVRAWLVVRLINKLGYPAERIELEHTYSIGRPSTTKAQID